MWWITSSAGQEHHIPKTDHELPLVECNSRKPVPVKAWKEQVLVECMRVWVMVHFVCGDRLKG